MTLGLIAGYFGGWRYVIIMRFMDALMSFPMILLALLITTLLGGGLVNVMIAIIAKAVPQMHILLVGYPVKVFVGLIAMALTFPLVWPVMRDAFHDLHSQLLHIVRLL